MPRCGPAVVPPSRRRFRWLEPLLCGRCAKQPRGSTPAEGRAESVPEAGGTGAAAVATPTTPPAGHAADSPANRRPRPEGIGGRRENIRRLSGGNVRPSGWPGGLPNRERCRSGGFPGGSKGGGSTPRQPAVIPWVCWLGALSLCQASLGVPPTHLSGHRPEQRPPDRRGQARRPRDRRPHAVLDTRQTGERSLTRRGV